MTILHELLKLGQSVWMDNISRGAGPLQIHLVDLLIRLLLWQVGAG